MRTFALLLVAGTIASAQTKEIVGVWRGTSTCVDKEHYPACNNEVVVYTVVLKKGTKDTVTLSADKIVNGQREPMGDIDLTRKADGSWSGSPAAFPSVLFTLRISGDSLTGSLSNTATKRQVRDIAAKRSPN